MIKSSPTIVLPLYSTPIYYVEDVNYTLSDVEQGCIDSAIKSLHEKTDVSLTTDVHVLKNLALRSVHQLCQHHLDTFTKNYLHIKQDFYITNSWITTKNKGQHHHQHDHQNCIFSGVYYVNANENMGNLILHGKQGYLEKFDFTYDYDGTWNYYNSSNWAISVKSGTMVIFPSHVLHSVEKSNDDDTRIVIGFNSFVKGDFGMEEGAYYCSQLKL
jgi:uncharacterized protein (TIGR02466 family)